MPRKRSKIHVTPGYGSSGQAFLNIAEWVYRSDSSMDFDVTEIASYSLQYLPDTKEVVLIKGDEIVYSEEVS